MKTPPISNKSLPLSKPDVSTLRTVSESFVEDWSELAIGESETGLESKLADLKVGLY